MAKNATSDSNQIATLAEGPPRSARVFEDLLYPGDWRVEWFDDNGDVELASFAGPKARERAIKYADRQYGTFLEIPYPYAR
jgi:hypothetical protein